MQVCLQEKSWVRLGVPTLGLGGQSHDMELNCLQ